MPADDRQHRERELAQQLPPGPELERVVEDAQDRRHGAAREEAEQLWARRSERGIVTIARRSLASSDADRHDENAVGDGDAAAARDRALVDAAVDPGWSTMSSRIASRAHERRDEQRRSAPRRRTPMTRSGSTSPNDAIRRIGLISRRPAGRPGTGKRATRSRTSAADPLVDGGVVAAADGLDDPAADLRASRGSRSRGSSSPACRRGCRRRCWAGWRRTGWRSC